MPKLGAGSSKKQQCQTDLLSTTKICGQNLMKWTILTGTAVEYYEQILLHVEINSGFQRSDEGATNLKKEM